MCHAPTQVFQEAADEDVDPLVTAKRAQIGPAFFNYVSLRADTLHDDPKSREGELSPSKALGPLEKSLLPWFFLQTTHARGRTKQVAP